LCSGSILVIIIKFNLVFNAIKSTWIRACQASFGRHCRHAACASHQSAAGQVFADVQRPVVPAVRDWQVPSAAGRHPTATCTRRPRDIVDGVLAPLHEGRAPGDGERQRVRRHPRDMRPWRKLFCGPR